MTFTSIAFGLISGFVGWMLTEFVAKPFRKGIDLIAEARSLSIIYANVQARHRETGTDGTGPLAAMDIPQEAEERLQLAERSFREQGARLQAFAKTDVVAAKALKLLKVDVEAAGIAFIGLSNNVGIYGKNRNDANTRLTTALGIL
jgi:hypothetical protein